MVAHRHHEARSAADFMPVSRSLSVLRTAANGCRGCDLYKTGTQAVFGEGPRDAAIMMVGEQPGDQEDLSGRPFVGPAGMMLDRALEETGIDRSDVYMTNAVKHFKWEARGKRRIHSKPNQREVKACRPWLERELQIVQPPMLVLLGSTAAQSLMGNAFRVTRERGTPFESPWSLWTFATVHPSSLLRAPDEASRRQGWSAYLSDFKVIARQYRKVIAARAGAR